METMKRITLNYVGTSKGQRILSGEFIANTNNGTLLIVSGDVIRILVAEDYVDCYLCDCAEIIEFDVFDGMGNRHIVSGNNGRNDARRTFLADYDYDVEPSLVGEFPYANE